MTNKGGIKLLQFLGGVLEGLFRAEVNDPAVRRAVRVVESAAIAALMVYLRSRGLSV